MAGAGATAEIRVLGPVEVLVNGEPVPLAAKLRRVVAVLVMHRGETRSAEGLIDAVWGVEPAPSGRHLLQVYVSGLRKALPAGVQIVTRGGGYALEMPSDALDATRFERLLEEGRAALAAGDAAAAVSMLGAALALWRGEAYADLADDGFARPEAVRLGELRAAAEIARLDALLEMDRADEAAAEAVRLIDANPYREPVWERRMRALHAAGRTVEAIRVFHQYRELLADETGLDPSPELVALERALVAGPPSAALEPVAGLPTPLTELVGRYAARDELVKLVADHRVVTLTGPPGVGKTRLAVEVASAYRERAGVPVAFVELAPVGPDGAVSAVTRAFGVAEAVDPTAALRWLIADRSVLLVLDNCEHVLEAAAELVEVLVPFCPALRVLVTSRARLDVSGECVWAVPPLPVPSVGPVESLSDLDAHAATLLFLVRAAAHAEIDDSPEAARAVASICAAVDGLPLGIELAAALTRDLPLDRLVEGLTARDGGAARDRAAARHRSLGGAVGWSYEMLDPVTQRLFRRLAVFEGGWTLDAAEELWIADDGDMSAVPARVGELASSSLVTFDPASRRYSMLETIRVFAVDRLAQAGESDAARRAHVRWCRRLAETAAPGVAGPVSPTVTTRLNAERPNLLAAMRFALANPGETDDLVGATRDLRVFWEAIEPSREVLEAATELFGRAIDLMADSDPELLLDLLLAREAALGRLGDRTAQRRDLDAADRMVSELDDPDRRVKVLLRRASWHFHHSEYAGQVRLAKQAVDLARRSGLPERETDGLLWGGMGLTWANLHTEAWDMLERSLASARATGQRRQEGESLRYLSIVANNRSEYRTSIDLLKQARAVHQGNADRDGETKVLVQLASVLYNLGRHAEARPHLETALPVYVASGDLYARSVVTANLGAIVLVQGELGRARRLVDEGLALARELGDREGAAVALGLLGDLYRRVGDIERAEGHLNESVVIAREIDFAFVVSDTHLVLALLALDRGNPDEAVVIVDEAVAAATRAESPWTRARAQFGRGECLLRCGRLDDAESALAAAAEEAEQIGLRDLPLEITAGRARVALERGDLHEAATLVQGLLGHLDGDDLDGAILRADVHLTCCRVLARLDDPRAADARRAGRQYVERYAARIDEEPLREGFLRVPAHVRLMADPSRS
jgi:predicted ATPase/DNA-binding SARP family transcriptional activator